MIFTLYLYGVSSFGLLYLLRSEYFMLMYRLITNEDFDYIILLIIK